MIRIFDSTLTLGEMVPGVSFGLEGKLEIASHLDTLGVDVIEAGFPASSEGEKRVVREVVRNVKRLSRSGLSPEVCALARAMREDVKAAVETGVDSVNIFIPASRLLLERAYGMREEEARERVREAVSLAKSHDLTVEFTAEDAGRSDDLLWDLCRIAEESGADRINLSDPVGAMLPDDAKKIVLEAKKRIRKPISVTFSNDLGMATANSLSAAIAGADQIHVSVNGLGPKAGIAPLEQVVVGLKKLAGLDTNVKMELLPSVSEAVERISGIPISEISPIVGPLVFTYEAGVHVSAISNEPSSYEIVSPGEVGRVRRFWVGTHSGRKAVKEVLKEMGYSASDSDVERILARVKELSQEGVRITEAIFRSVVEEVLGERPRLFKVKEWVAVTGSGITPTATIRALIGGREVISSSSGVGPVDAITKAIRSIQGIPSFNLRRFRLIAVSSGSEAIAELKIRVVGPKGEVEAAGTSRDIVDASLKAIEEAVNKIIPRES